MRVRVLPVLLATVLAAAVLLAPQRTTQASWTDQASTSATLTSLDVAPTLACTSNGLSADITWTQPATSYGHAPVTYTATVRRGTGTPTAATITSNGANRTITFNGGLTLIGATFTIEVVATLPGTTWTATRSTTVTVLGLLSLWEVRCP